MAVVTVLRDHEALAAAAAERVASLLRSAIAARRRADLCLSGGQTPRRLYELLADPSHPFRSTIDWTRVHVFWGDERQVPPDHAESNFGMAHRVLLTHVPIPAGQIHRIRGELGNAAEAANEYESVLSGILDVALLGLGADGHIASIFPGSPLLTHDRLNRVAAVRVDHLHVWRITLTPSALLAARAIVVLVSGADKAAAVRAALDEPDDIRRWPAQLLRAAGGRVEWFIDAAAAQRRDEPPA